jgi:hypothetical protein
MTMCASRRHVICRSVMLIIRLGMIPAASLVTPVRPLTSGVCEGRLGELIMREHVAWEGPGILSRKSVVRQPSGDHWLK